MIDTKIKVKFKSWPSVLVIEEYQETGETALVLLDEEEDEEFGMRDVVATATVCHPELIHVHSKDYVLIKEWSENEGMVDALVEAKIISKPIASINVNPWGSTASLCKLLIDVNSFKNRKP